MRSIHKQVLFLVLYTVAMCISTAKVTSSNFSFTSDELTTACSWAGTSHFRPGADKLAERAAVPCDYIVLPDHSVPVAESLGPLAYYLPIYDRLQEPDFSLRI